MNKLMKRSYPKLRSFTPKRTGVKVHPIINKNYYVKSTIEEDARLIGGIDDKEFSPTGYFMIAWQEDLTTMRAFKSSGDFPISTGSMGLFIKEMFDDIIGL